MIRAWSPTNWIIMRSFLGWNLELLFPITAVASLVRWHLPHGTATAASCVGVPGVIEPWAARAKGRPGHVARGVGVAPRLGAAAAVVTKGFHGIAAAAAVAVIAVDVGAPGIVESRGRHDDAGCFVGVDGGVDETCFPREIWSLTLAESMTSEAYILVHHWTEMNR